MCGPSIIVVCMKLLIPPILPVRLLKKFSLNFRLPGVDMLKVRNFISTDSTSSYDCSLQVVVCRAMILLLFQHLMPTSTTTRYMGKNGTPSMHLRQNIFQIKSPQSMQSTPQNSLLPIIPSHDLSKNSKRMIP